MRFSQPRFKTHLTTAKSKSILDEIDKVLAAHYGFTEEEMETIINYDIKCRMGKDLRRIVQMTEVGGQKSEIRLFTERAK
jgi:hypothetical protein